MKVRFVASAARLTLSASILALAVTSANAQQATATADPSQDPIAAGSDEDTTNAIIVSGIRLSIESSIGDKRNASEIKDSITAEDIGQLANDNVAEALQRIPGVEINRSNDGAGKQVQIRGLSENNVTVNGATATGTGDVDLSNGNDRSVNFQDIPAELFSGVEILKASTADKIEGSLGGTINLQTRAPLKGKRDFVVNVSASDIYRPYGKRWSPSANIFVQKKFLDTPVGDIGVILNFGYKKISSVTAVYGGGEFFGAPGIWLRMSGASPLPTSTGANQTAANYNFFALANVPNATTGSVANPYRYSPIDANADGVADAGDTVYIPNSFGLSRRTRDDKRKTFNGTLEWKPASNLDIRFDTVLSSLDQNLTGANFNLVSNVPRAGILSGGPTNVFEKLGDSAGLGPVYVMTDGRLASFVLRGGAQPSINQTRRDSQQYALQTTWDVTSTLSLFAEGSISRGKATTLNFGQLNTSIEQQGGNGARLNNQDFYNIVDFSLGDNLIPNVTMYEDPFPSAFFGVNSVVPNSALKPLTIGDLSYERLRYFTYQRNAADTNNKDDSARLDATWKLDNGFISMLKGGFRWASREFTRQSFVNQNQGGNNPYGIWDGVRPPLQAVTIQQIPVNPANTTDTVAAATSTFLQSCLTTTDLGNALTKFGGNLPFSFGTTGGCDITAVQNYFNMIDIRAVNPATGAGYYENIPERFNVSDETAAAYLQADFKFPIGSVDVFGNAGVRYVRTDTTSSGYALQADQTYSIVSFKNNYDDWLPSGNINFSLDRKLMLRMAYSRTLGRPQLTQIAPSLVLSRNNNGGEYAGSGLAGNPYLKAIHSDNFDASLEWYYEKGSYLSVAVFAKNIDSTIYLDPTQVDLQIGDELFSVSTYRNFGGTKIKGLEIGMSHAFGYLPGILRHLGVTGNLTLLDESSSLRDQEGDPISRRGLSKVTYNMGGYYDDGTLSLRLAYNWRSAFTRIETVPLGFASNNSLPETEGARGQLDFAARFSLTKQVKFTFDAINLTNTGTFRYLKYPVLVNYVARAGRAFNMGVAVNF